MSDLRFSDGVRVDTTGPYRVIKLEDGYYVTGHGLLSPEGSREEAEAYVQELEAGDQERGYEGPDSPEAGRGNF